ncbi:YhdP family protein [Agarivorans sp. MS3-6]
MANPFTRGVRKCWHGFALLLVIIAVCLSIARGILAFASHYKDDIATWLVNDTNATLSIGKLNARIHNFRPMLVFEDSKIAIGEQKDLQFSVDALMFEIDLWQSVEQSQVVFKDLVLDGVHFKLAIDPHKTSAKRSSPQNYQVFADLFLSQLARFSVTNSLIEINFPEYDLNLDIASLDWVNNGNLHQGDGEILIGQDLQNGQVKFRVDLLGDTNNLEGLTGKFYAKAQHLNMKAMQRAFGRSAEQFNSDLNLSLWADFGAKRQQRWLMQWQPSVVNWGAKQNQLVINSGLTQGLKVEDKWRVDKLPWDMALNDTADADFSLQGLITKEQQSWQLAELDLAAWSSLLALIDNQESNIAWHNLITAGQLKHLDLDYFHQSKDLRYTASLEDVASLGQSFIPSLEYIDIEIAGDKSGAALQLNQQGKFGLAAQFDEILDIELFDSEITLSFAAPGLSIKSQYTHLITPELDFAGQWSLVWPEQGAWPVLSLMANAEIKDAGKAYYYYPKVMPEGVFDYLKGALLAGIAEQSQVLWYGQLNHYPYQQHNGIFQAFVPLNNARFKFDPGWPSLNELQLDLLFQNDGLFMESQRARLGEVPAQRITASIPKFYSGSELYITGNVAGSAEAVSEYLLQSPITALSDSLAQLPLSSGDVSGEVYLNIPLHAGTTVEVNGHVDFQDNNLGIIPTGMNLTQLNGRLYFQNEQLRTNNLNAMWRGLPLKVKFTTQADAENYLLDFDLAGRWPMTTAERSFGIPLNEYSSGKLDWQGDLLISLKPEGAFDYSGDFRSELLGLALKFPEPLDKLSEQSWPTALSLSGNQDGGDYLLEANQLISAQAKISFEEQQARLKHALLNLGPSNNLLWQGEGLAMSFDFPELELEPWMKWAKQQIKYSPKKPETDYTNVSLVIPELMFVRGAVQQAKFMGQPLDNFDVAYLPRSKTQVQIESDQLLASVSAPEQPTVEQPVKIIIEKAQLDEIEFSLFEEQTDQVIVQLEQQEQLDSLLKVLPPLSLACNDCQLGDYRIGNMKLDLPIEDQTMDNGRLWVDWGHSSLTAALFWKQADGHDMAGLAGSFSSNSLEKVIEDMGHDSPLKGTAGRFTFDVSWQDALYRPEMASLDGSIKVKTDKGVVTEMSDKGTRLLTLASLDTIRRRLTLDFSDVFEKGLHFDSVEASIAFDKGLANNQDFYLDGVAGSMRGKGEVDFRDGQIDYLVSYSPKVTSSLPVLAAFLVTPATGVAVLALSKLLEPVVEVVTQIDFALKGNIGEPQLIELERVKKEIKVPDEFRTREGSK